MKKISKLGVEMEFYNTYYFCDIADNVMRDTFSYLSSLESFSNGFSYGVPADFPKYSLLHEYCQWIVQTLFTEDAEWIADIEFEKRQLKDCNDKEIIKICETLSKNSLLIERTSVHYLDQEIDFRKWLTVNYREFDYLDDAFARFYEDMTMKYDALIDRISREMFYVLFGNREFLLRLNSYVAGCHEHRIIRKPPPVWVKNAVFYRDKGRCVFCNRDLSGIIDIPDPQSIHFDHIVPLEAGGLNDVSNMQLTCEQCNKAKHTASETSKSYRSWYEV